MELLAKGIVSSVPMCAARGLPMSTLVRVG